MPRVNDIYQLPPGVHGIPDTPIQSQKYNLTIDDLANDANQPRPIGAGGTGAQSKDEALETLGVNDALDELKTELDEKIDAIGSGLPVGSIVDFAGAAAPTGWLLCTGQAVSRTTYAALFDVLGTTYGAGNGTSTFNLPDTRGRTTVGVDASQSNRIDITTYPNARTIGGTMGESTVTLSASQLPAHAHPASAASGGSHNHSFTGTAASAGAHTHSVSGTAASNGAHTHSSSVASVTTTPSPVRFLNAGADYHINPISGSDTTSSAGAHTHSVSGTAASAGAHTHSVSGTTASDGAHSHTITVSNNTGGGGAHGNMQPAIAMNKIIKAVA